MPGTDAPPRGRRTVPMGHRPRHIRRLSTVSTVGVLSLLHGVATTSSRTAGRNSSKVKVKPGNYLRDVKH